MSHLHYLCSIQTLTTLALGENKIGAEGAQFIATALARNTVSYTLCAHIVFSPSLLNIDIENSESI